MTRDDNHSFKGDPKKYIYETSDDAIFKVLILEFSNLKSEDVEIDFKDFILPDSNGLRYDPVSVAQLYKPTPTFEKFKHTLHAGKTKMFEVRYWPPFPKNESVTNMVVKRVPIDKIQYILKALPFEERFLYNDYPKKGYL